MQTTARHIMVRVVAVLALLAGGPAAALSGAPPFWRVQPDLDVFPQNNAIAQDADGIVYVGNADGVMEYDGERWRLIPTDNGDLVRSLAVGPDGRVWVGGYDSFGWLERDAAGQAHYRALDARFDADLQGRGYADIWQVLVMPEGVYFRAVRDLFFIAHDGGRALHWHHEGRFGVIASWQGRVIIQFRGVGFKERVEDRFESIAGTEGLTGMVFGVNTMADDSLLTRGSDGAWRRIAPDGTVTPLAMPAGMPPSSEMQPGIVLTDGSLALGAVDGQVYIVDAALSELTRFQLDEGYIADLHPAREGGFLVTGDEYIYRVAWPTRWRLVGSEQGYAGSLLGVRMHGGHAYLFTTGRTYRAAKRAGHGGTSALEPVFAEEQSLYDMLPLDADNSLFAGQHRLRWHTDGRSVDLVDELVYPREFHPSRHHPGRVYVTTEFGVRVIDTARRTVSDSSTPGQDVRAYDVVETTPDEIWYGSERSGLWRARLDAQGRFTEVASVGVDTGLRFGPIPGARLLVRRDGSLVVSTNAGLFRRAGERFEPVDLDGLAARRHPDEWLRLAETANGDLWAYGVRRVLQRRSGGVWTEHDVRALLRGGLVGHARGDDDGVFALVATGSLLVHDAGASEPDMPPGRVRLRSVTRLMADGTREPLALRTDAPLVLPQGDYGLQFQFALPGLGDAGAIAYQGRLLGYEERHSDWSRAREYQYYRLRPGDYTLEVRARDGRERESEITPYRLIVQAPWYWRTWAQATWLLLGLVALVLLTRLAIRRRTRRLALETARLESVVAERTRDLAAANERLATMAWVDGLTGVANRRRLDQFVAEHHVRARADGESLAVLAIDVDHFKRYNDTHGHLAGDQLLRALAQVLARGLDGADALLARYGGEEFMVVAPGLDPAAARALADRLHAAVRAASLGGTVSIGVAAGVATGEPEDLLRAADRALYQAKADGRDRVV